MGCGLSHTPKSIFEDAQILEISQKTVLQSMMRDTLDLARAQNDNIPIACSIYSQNGHRLMSATNGPAHPWNPLAHAELQCLSQFISENDAWALREVTLVTTLEPCLMCAGAIVHCGVPRVVFGASNVESGAGGSVWDPMRDKRLGSIVEVIGGVLAEECQSELQLYFRGLR